MPAAMRSIAEWAASDRMLTDPVANPATSFPAVSKVLLATESHATRFFSIQIDIPLPQQSASAPLRVRCADLSKNITIAKSSLPASINDPMRDGLTVVRTHWDTAIMHASYSLVISHPLKRGRWGTDAGTHHERDHRNQQQDLGSRPHPEQSGHL